MYPDIKSLAVGPDGTVWAATSDLTRYGVYKGGVSYYDDSSWKTFTEKDGLLYNKVNSLALDSDDNLWVGTGAGVSHFDGTYWRNYTNTQGLTSYDVNSVAIDNQGTVWAYSSENGLHRQNKKTEMWEPIESPLHDYFGTIVMGSGSDIWLGAWNLYQYDGSAWTKYPTQSACSLIFGSDQKLYAAGHMGIIRARSNGIYERFPGIPKSVFNFVTADPFGDIWYCISTGFFRLDTTVTSVLKTGASPISFAITSNCPNPFNPSTTISFTLPTAARAELSVYSITGQKIRTLLSGPMTAGSHSAVWDGRMMRGKRCHRVFISPVSPGGNRPPPVKCSL